MPRPQFKPLERTVARFDVDEVSADKEGDFLAHYHRRSNVETVFSMAKGKFGSYVNSKNCIAPCNEVYAKFICHNICVLISSVYELNLVPEFWQDQGTEVA